MKILNSVHIWSTVTVCVELSYCYTVLFSIFHNLTWNVVSFLKLTVVMPFVKSPSQYHKPRKQKKNRKPSLSRSQCTDKLTLTRSSWGNESVELKFYDCGKCRLYLVEVSRIGSFFRLWKTKCRVCPHLSNLHRYLFFWWMVRLTLFRDSFSRGRWFKSHNSLWSFLSLQCIFSQFSFCFTRYNVLFYRGIYHNIKFIMKDSRHHTLGVCVEYTHCGEM